MATNTTEPSDLISRLDVPMTPAAAEAVLLWGFTDQAVETMNELAEKARQGTLSAEEQAAVDMFERTNNMLGILKSRARQLLSATSESSAS